MTEEARRLFFVALTRSKKYLFLSSFRELSYKEAKQLPAKFTTGVNGKARTLTSTFLSDLVGELPNIQTGQELLQRFGIEDKR